MLRTLPSTGYTTHNTGFHSDVYLLIRHWLSLLKECVKKFCNVGFATQDYIKALFRSPCYHNAKSPKALYASYIAFFAQHRYTALGIRCLPHLLNLYLENNLFILG